MVEPEIISESNKRAASPSVEEPAPECPTNAHAAHPTTKRTGLGRDLLKENRRIIRIDNDQNLIDKGHEKTEYRAGGWTVINPPFHRMLPQFQAVNTQLDEEEYEEDEDEGEDAEDADDEDGGEDGSESPGPGASPGASPGAAPVSMPQSITNIDGLDLAAVLKGDKSAKLSLDQDKMIARFIVAYKDWRISKLKKQFNELLQELSFHREELGVELIAALRAKVISRLITMRNSMVSSKAVSVSKSEEGKTEIAFAAWTSAWLLPEWDGSMEEPALHLVQ
jgi:hypothetical protein